MSSGVPHLLKGKVALVTGSSRGMGRQNAIALAQHGASVVVNYVKGAAPAEEVVKEIESHGGKAVAIQADISKPEQVEKLFTEAVKHFGQLNIVMSNSGLEHFGAVDEVTPADFDRIFNVNTRGQFFVAQQAYKHLSNPGRLILISSISAQATGVHNHSVYSGSKAAVEAFARCFACDFGSKQITVNAIAPGGVKTDMYVEAARKYIPGGDNWTDDQLDKAVNTFSPLGRMGYPEDIAKVVVWLASDYAGWVNGQTIRISGGAAV